MSIDHRDVGRGHTEQHRQLGETARAPRRRRRRCRQCAPATLPSDPRVVPAAPDQRPHRLHHTVRPTRPGVLSNLPCTNQPPAPVTTERSRRSTPTSHPRRPADEHTTPVDPADASSNADRNAATSASRRPARTAHRSASECSLASAKSTWRPSAATSPGGRRGVGRDRRPGLGRSGSADPLLLHNREMIPDSTAGNRRVHLARAPSGRAPDVVDQRHRVAVAERAFRSPTGTGSRPTRTGPHGDPPPGRCARSCSGARYASVPRSRSLSEPCSLLRKCRRPDPSRSTPAAHRKPNVRRVDVLVHDPSAMDPSTTPANAGQSRPHDRFRSRSDPAMVARRAERLGKRNTSNIPIAKPLPETGVSTKPATPGPPQARKDRTS